jgi:DNA-binding CsgD family transcriptional regulator
MTTSYARPAQHGSRRPAGHLIGREAELTCLVTALAGAQQGRGGAVLVVGEPGGGKSRLAGAAVTAAAEAGMVTAAGRAGTVGPAVAYRPLAEALHALERAGRPATQGALGGYGPVLARLLLDTHPAGSGPLSPLAVAETVLRLAGVVGGERGLLLVLEDLHAADEGTLAVVEYLLDHVGQLPAMLLLTTDDGPGAAGELTAQVRRRGEATVIDLPPLGPSEVHRLLAAELGLVPADVDGGLVRRVTAESGGIPFVVGERARGLAAQPAGTPPRLPDAVAADVRRRAGRLGPDGVRLLRAAALFGPRFPLPVVQHSLGRAPGTLCETVRAAVSARLILQDGPGRFWYTFRYPLMARALRVDLVPAERADLATRTARALRELQPGLPGEWCERAAALHGLAGDFAESVRLYGEGARRATARGSAARAVRSSVNAHRLLGSAGTPELRAQVLERLLDALAWSARSGRVPAAALAPDLADDDRLSNPCRAGLHARMAEVAALTGGNATALHHLDVSRRLLGDRPDNAQAALYALASAQTEAAHPVRARPDAVLGPARTAAGLARQAGLPDVESKALLLLGQSCWDRDEETAVRHLERACETSRTHGLTALRTSAEVYLSMIATRRDGLAWRTERAREEALRRGDTRTALDADVVLALDEARRCEFAAAGDRICRATADAARVGYTRARSLLILAEAVRQAHQGRRAETEAALDRLAALPDAEQELRAGSHALARAFCALLQDRHEVAREEFRRGFAEEAGRPPVGDLGRDGAALLLDVLAGRTEAGCAGRAASSADGGSRWNRQFAGMARAVLLGRQGRTTEATAAAHAALEAAAPYPTARRLCLRLVARPAFEDGWGTPVDWLREAEEYLHGAGLPAVAGACRALLRDMGAPVPQRRPGVERIPEQLRRHGITVRECEVAGLLVERLGNKDIAGRLYISARTVEKHVASLLRKTGHPDRSSFVSAARALGLLPSS